MDKPDFAKFAEAFGLSDHDATAGFLEGVAKVLRPQGLNADTANRLLAIVHDIEPRDPIEGMIGTQMIAVNHVAMIMTRRIVTSDDSFLQTEIAVNLACKVSWNYLTTRPNTSNFDVLGGPLPRLAAEECRKTLHS